eukprot:CAMPEP_0113470990 /NCGR_PEP_ID=MMETSP0014_2-20120614/16741_1 /TAXON_ID=2857 /ORGANISM="Nitzschia sp." /LENGTH=677 /DNA_ID=CAMNT_0000363599 /DNA_START=165 /DNA_END=2198 /DNA_ORIENTATION=+ /assembly_acc=CAM_ASM_000159
MNMPSSSSSSAAAATKTSSSTHAASPNTHINDVNGSSAPAPVSAVPVSAANQKPVVPAAALKRAQIRHKRNPNDPNRIDDLVLLLESRSPPSSPSPLSSSLTTTETSNDDATTVGSSSSSNHHYHHHHDRHDRHHPPPNIVLDFAQPHHERIRDRIFRLDSLNATTTITTTDVDDVDDDDGGGGADDENDNGDNKADVPENHHHHHEQQQEVPSSLRCYYQGPLYGIHGFPGFVVAPDALHRNLQHRLAWEAVTTYCNHPPYRTNLTAGTTTTTTNQKKKEQEEEEDDDQQQNKQQHHDDERKEPSMWEDWKEQQKQQVQHHQQQQQQQNQHQHQHQHQHQTKKKAKKVHHSNDKINNSSNSNKSNNKQRKLNSLEKLSWATMGLHYDWTERSYSRHHKSPMPPLVGTLSRLFADTAVAVAALTNSHTIGMSNTKTPPPPPPPPPDGNSGKVSSSFVPSAAIVNYYNTKSTMGGHRDDLEEALDQPIVSISVGLPAIFVLGGLNKEDDDDDDDDDDYSDGNNGTSRLDHSHKTSSSSSPVPVVTSILIRPGDVVIMSGPSRLRYHAMARVLPKEAATKLATTVKNNVESEVKSGSHPITLEQLLITGGGDEEEGERKICVRCCDGVEEEILADDDDDDDDKVFLKKYLENHRININVRQVYPDDKWEDFVCCRHRGM